MRRGVLKLQLQHVALALALLNSVVRVFLSLFAFP